MTTVTARLGAWQNETIRAEVDYDDITFIVSAARLINNAPLRCRFSAWRSDNTATIVSINVNAGQTRTGKPQGTVIYHPEENPDGVTPAGNLEFRVEYPI
jgi:hypothetical protein